MGGVEISGAVGNVGGDIVGGDKVGGNKVTHDPSAEFDSAVRPVIEAIKAAPSDKQREAEAKIRGLKQEAAKGKEASDRTIADLVDGLVKLVPGAVSAVVGAFATPVLGGIAGPVTGFVLDKLRGE